MHREAGFEVPRYWSVEVSGLRGLAVERFDRTPEGSPLFMESLYSIMASGSRRISNHYSASYDRIGQVLDSPRIQLVSDRKQAKLHLFERLVMALLTGNGDLHLENLSIIERNGELGFSPVYDPTPMRAYRIHDMLTPPGMTFGDYGDYLEHSRSDQPVNFSQAFERFTRGLGLRSRTWKQSVERLLASSDDFVDRVDALQTLPAANKQHLISIHRKIRQQLEQLTG